MNLETDLADLAEPAPATLATAVTAALGLTDVYLTVGSPTGPLRVAFNTKSGISFVDAAVTGEEQAFVAAYAARYPTRPPLRPAPPRLTPPPGLLDALHGRTSASTLTFDLSSCSPFQEAVLRKAAQIPAGEVRSYGWIAREIGHDGATRAVGTALGRNPAPVLIPCHRVVRTDGTIGNYALGTARKHALLRHEGVDLDDLQQLAAAGHRYVGSATTHIFCVPTCRQARRIEPHNRVVFKTGSQAAMQGYRPCKTCRPAAPALSTT